MEERGEGELVMFGGEREGADEPEELGGEREISAASFGLGGGAAMCGTTCGDLVW